MNGCYMTCRVRELPKMSETGTNSKCTMVVECDRPFRAMDGSIPSDIFFVEVWRGIADELMAACQVGSTIVIQGRMESTIKQIEGQTFYDTRIIAENVDYPERRRQIDRSKEAL